jgi:hypothetical protein
LSSTKKWLLGAAAFWLTLLVAVGVYLRWDEDLQPEVQQALSWQVPEHAFDDNGYLILLGMEAPASANAAEVGAATLKRELSRWAEFQTTHKSPPLAFKAPTPLDTNADGANMACPYDRERHCVEFYLRQDRRQLDQWVAARATLITRYQDIGKARRYVEVVPPLTVIEVAPFKSLGEAMEIHRMQAVLAMADGEIDKGLALLADNAALSKRLMRAASHVVSHAVALAHLQRDVRVLSELLQRDPRLAGHPSPHFNTLLEPITGQALQLTTALMHERATQLHLLDSLRHHDTKTLFGPNDGHLLLGPEVPSVWSVAAHSSFLPNATLNEFHALATAYVALASTDAPALDRAKAQLNQRIEALAPIDHTVITRRNPTGRILIRIGAVDFARYVERQHDVNAFIGMVARQRDAARNPSLTPAALGATDPYTLAPIPYDQSAGVLSFEGRQPNNSNFEKSSRYQVPLR